MAILAVGVARTDVAGWVPNPHTQAANAATSRVAMRRGRNREGKASADTDSILVTTVDLINLMGLLDVISRAL